MMTEALQALGDHIKASLPGKVTGSAVSFGELTIEANAADIVAVLRFLHDDPQCLFFNFTDLCGADVPAPPRIVRAGDSR